MYFTSLEKKAIIHVNMNMLSADGYMLSSEQTLMAALVSYLGADSEDFSGAQCLSDREAERVISMINSSLIF